MKFTQPDGITIGKKCVFKNVKNAFAEIVTKLTKNQEKEFLKLVTNKEV